MFCPLCYLKEKFTQTDFLFVFFLLQSITVQTISGTGSLRVGANFLVSNF